MRRDARGGLVREADLTHSGLSSSQALPGVDDPGVAVAAYEQVVSAVSVDVAGAGDGPARGVGSCFARPAVVGGGGGVGARRAEGVGEPERDLPCSRGRAGGADEQVRESVSVHVGDRRRAATQAGARASGEDVGGLVEGDAAARGQDGCEPEAQDPRPPRARRGADQQLGEAVAVHVVREGDHLPRLLVGGRAQEDEICARERSGPRRAEAAAVEEVGAAAPAAVPSADGAPIRRSSVPSPSTSAPLATEVPAKWPSPSPVST